MGRNRQLKSAQRRPGATVRRVALIGAPEVGAPALADDLRYLTRVSIDRVKETIELLRRSHGLSLPRFDADWDEVPTQTPSPASTLAAYEGTKRCVRITIHINHCVDDTTAVQLAQDGISHLVGLSIRTKLRQPVWESSAEGGMLALIQLPRAAVEAVLHDIFLDMALVHTRGQPWSGLRERLSSMELAAAKISYLKSMGFTDSYSHGDISRSLYAPLCAIAGAVPAVGGRLEFDAYLRRVVEGWTKFAVFVATEEGTEIQVTADDAADRILKEHRNGGQISRTALVAALGCLAPGHYCLFLLARKATNAHKIAQISGFFHCRPSKFRTQRWIVHPRCADNKLEHILLTEGYISRFPFYFGDSK